MGLVELILMLLLGRCESNRGNRRLKQGRLLLVRVLSRLREWVWLVRVREVSLLLMLLLLLD